MKTKEISSNVEIIECIKKFDFHLQTKKHLCIFM